MNYDPVKVREMLSLYVSPARYLHLLGTAGTMRSLAQRFGFSPEDAYFAGLWHDLARELSPTEILTQVAERNIKIYPYEKADPILAHGAVAAAKIPLYHRKPSNELCRAVRWHTSGHPGLEDMGKALFVADYLEPSREHITREEAERILALKTLNDMVIARCKHAVRTFNNPLLPATKAMLEEIRRQR